MFSDIGRPVVRIQAGYSSAVEDAQMVMGEDNPFYLEKLQTQEPTSYIFYLNPGIAQWILIRTNQSLLEQSPALLKTSAQLSFSCPHKIGTEHAPACRQSFLW